MRSSWEKKLPIRLQPSEIILFILFFLFASWLMWHTFTYHNHTIYIAAKAWSDFSATLPLARSFAWGNNFPPEDPLFAGEPMHYHLLFYLLVGLLEKSGLPLDFCLNSLSIVGFFGLLVGIYYLAKFLFNKKSIALVSVLLFLCNGSLAFIEYFKNNPLSLLSLREIMTNDTFPSFGPYDGKIVSAFWNLNIYTNQRHLALAFALIIFLLLFILVPIKKKKKFSLRRSLISGIFLGLLPFVHSVGFFSSFVIVSMLFLLFPKYRKPLFITLSIGALLGLPQLFFMQPAGVSQQFRFKPGYLISHDLTLKNFIQYWFANLGLGFFLIPLGFLASNRFAKKVLLSFTALFVIGNLFQFSREIAANHKFFNLFILVANIFSAYSLFFIAKKHYLGKILAIVFLFFLLFSGIIDFFAVKNDSFISLADAPLSADVSWIKNNTPPKSNFLNTSYLYHPANIAGRKIFLGWPYFPWAGGLDTDNREKMRQDLLETTGSKQSVCRDLRSAKIDFVALGKNDPSELTPNYQFWQSNFTLVYNNPQTDLKIYSVKQSCP